MRFLALYTGPMGPISHAFETPDLSAAMEHVATQGHEWYDAAADALGLDPDSQSLDSDITAALEAGGWSLVRRAEHTGEYAIYQRPYRPEACS